MNNVDFVMSASLQLIDLNNRYFLIVNYINCNYSIVHFLHHFI